MKFVAEYKAHLQWVEELTANVVSHAPPPGPDGDSFRADLAGLLSTSYVAAFECAVKAVFTTFATSKHKLLGNVAGHHFRQINSKIHWNKIGDEYARQFGESYRVSFYRILDQREAEVLQRDRVSVKETYANLLKWRHAFAHEGKKLATLDEVVKAYRTAVIVIEVLDDTMSS